MAEIERQVKLMLELGIIKRSRARRWSHIILTLKKGGSWRIVLDYRELNECIKARTGYLPKIRDILAFIGQAKAKYFIVMDFTSGFHQAPLHPDSQIYTAFWTHFGVFEWTRVPMGPTDSPKYFQETLMHEVLQGLVMNICALYMDDLIIFGKTEHELLEAEHRQTTLLKLCPPGEAIKLNLRQQISCPARTSGATCLK
jgi:hypothetical protein